MRTNIALFAQQMSAAKCLSTALLVSLVTQTADWEWAAGATVGAGPDHKPPPPRGELGQWKG